MPDRTLCLTFDDGPGLHTLEIAEYLHENGIPGAFFLLGNYAQRVPPEDLRRLVELGHLIGNHTQSHEGWMLHPIEEVASVHRVIEPFATTGQLGRLPFRAPRGIWNPSLAASLNSDEHLRRTYFGPVGWDIDARDWEFWRNNADVRDDRALNDCVAKYLSMIDLRRRGIVLLHSNYPPNNKRISNRTNQVVERIVPRLRLEGYKFVGLDEILQIRTAAAVASRYALRSAVDGRVLSVKRKTGHVISRRGRIGEAESFGEVPSTNGRIALATSAGYFLSAPAERGGRIQAIGQTIGEAELLVREDHGQGRIALRTNAGGYLISGTWLQPGLRSCGAADDPRRLFMLEPLLG